MNINFYSLYIFPSISWTVPLVRGGAPVPLPAPGWGRPRVGGVARKGRPRAAYRPQEMGGPSAYRAPFRKQSC